MKTHTILRTGWACALAAVALAACGLSPESLSQATSAPAATAVLPTAVPPTAVPPPAEAAETELAEAVLTLVNAERGSAGCPGLMIDARLNAAAQGHSDDMAGNDFMDHTGSDGSQVGDRARAAGYSWRSVGENVAAGYATPAEVVAGWMGSPGHRDIILTCGYVDLGLGYSYRAATEFGHYWALVLAS